MQADGEQSGEMAGLPMPMIALFSSSLLFQIIHVGAFPVYLSTLMSERGYGPQTIGFYAAISWLSILVFGPFVPQGISRLGFRSSIILSFLTTAGALLVMQFFWNYVALAIAAILLGFGLIIRWISFDALVVDMAPEAARGRLVGLHESLMGLGIAIGPALFVFLAPKLIGILLMVVAAAACVLFQFIRVPEGRSSPATEAEKIELSLLVPLFLALAGASVAGAVESASISLFPIQLTFSGYTFHDSALMLTSFGIGGTLMQPVLGFIADRRGYKLARALCIAAIFSSCLLLMLVMHNQLISLPLMFVLGGAAGGLNTLAVIEAGMTIRPNRIPAAMTAIAMSYTLGGVFGPVISGSVLNLAGNMGMLLFFISLAAVLALSGLLRSSMSASTDQ